MAVKPKRKRSRKPTLAQRVAKLERDVKALRGCVNDPYRREPRLIGAR